jgi:phage tail-like protein
VAEQYKGNGGPDGANGAGHNGSDGENGTGNGRFSGPGFGTLMIQMVSGPKETPPVASSRAYLRNGLPALYQDGDFGMRFVGALEELLDPIVAVLDGLPYHFDPNFAPPDILTLLASWLGVDLDETQNISQQREMVLRAAELSRRRGTRSGMELALKLFFPDVPMRVEDNGGVIWHSKPGPADKPASSFIVYCDVPIEETMQAAIARCIEQYKPVHSTYRLRVKAAKRKVES